MDFRFKVAMTMRYSKCLLLLQKELKYRITSNIKSIKIFEHPGLLTKMIILPYLISCLLTIVCEAIYYMYCMLIGQTNNYVNESFFC